MAKFNTFYDKLTVWLSTLSERTLTLSSIAILHVVFLPNALAFLNGLTDRLPNLDAYLLVVLALVITNLRSIMKNDKVASLIHLAGFVGQLTVLALILMK